MPPVPVSLIAGFLGSGKTTLLNRILAGEHGRRVAVLVNDFGDVSIDAELVASATETTLTLANGCICCSIRDDLVGAVRDLLRREPPPEHLVVEMSGIADPGNVLRTVALMEKKWPIFLDGVLALVDAEHFPLDEATEHHLLAREQLVLADVVLLNKTDLVSAERLAALRARVRAWVPSARIVETVQADIPLELLLGLGSTATRARVDPELAAMNAQSHGREHGFSTFTYRSRKMLALDALRESMTELPPGVFRAKGFVHLDARPEYRTVLQIVGRRARIELGEPWGEREPETVLVFIGPAGALDADDLRARLDACVAKPARVGFAPLERAVAWLRRRAR